MGHMGYGPHGQCGHREMGAGGVGHMASEAHRGKWGAGGMGYIGHRDTGGNGVQAVWGIWAMRPTGGTGYMGHMGNRGYGVQGVWATSAIGHMANEAMGPVGDLNIFAHNIIKLDILTHLT